MIRKHKSFMQYKCSVNGVFFRSFSLYKGQAMKRGPIMHRTRRSAGGNSSGACAGACAATRVYARRGARWLYQSQKHVLFPLLNSPDSCVLHDVGRRLVRQGCQGCPKAAARGLQPSLKTSLDRPDDASLAQKRDRRMLSKN